MNFEAHVLKKLDEIDKKVEALNEFMHKEQGKSQVKAYIAGGSVSLVVSLICFAATKVLGA